MFERMAANDVAGGKDLLIEGLETFREDIEHRDDPEICAAGVACWKQEQEKRES